MLRKVNIEDVAKAAGVSRALVSIAYRGVAGVSDSTREAIFEAGKKLGYVPNLNASRLASKGLKTIGVFLQDLHNETFADVFDGIRSVINDGDAQIVLSVGSTKPEHDGAALETLLASRVDVLIAAGLTMPDSELSKFAKRTKLISVTRKSSVTHSVAADDLLGAKLATKHLIDLGHRRIAFLANPQTDGYRERLVGYQQTIDEADLGSLVIESSYLRAEAEADAGQLIDSLKPTAIFAHNDQAALGVLDALVARKLRPGVDISVVGYDNTSLSQMPILSLTTVDPHSFQLGEKSGLLALELMASDSSVPHSIVLTPELVTRSSSAEIDKN